MKIVIFTVIIFAELQIALSNTDMVKYQINRYGYFLSPERTWSNARKYCVDNGGDLATVGMRDLTTRKNIMLNLKPQEYAWIGLSDSQKEGCFKWVDGYDGEGCASDTSAHWNVEQPDDFVGDEDCVHVLLEDEKWLANDIWCAWKYPGVCEIKFD